jgi:hypothetical protein
VVWGAERTILLFVSEELRMAEHRGLEQQLAKRVQELEAWRDGLGKPKSGTKDAAKALAKVKDGQYLKDFLRVSFASTNRLGRPLSCISANGCWSPIATTGPTRRSGSHGPPPHQGPAPLHLAVGGSGTGNLGPL